MTRLNKSVILLITLADGAVIYSFGYLVVTDDLIYYKILLFLGVLNLILIYSFLIFGNAALKWSSKVGWFVSVLCFNVIGAGLYYYWWSSEFEKIIQSFQPRRPESFR